jgi:hypothetical protein
MITAVVTFKLPPEMSREKWQENIKQVSARFQNLPGLIRKQFLYNDKGVGGGSFIMTRVSAAVCTSGRHVRLPRTATTKALGTKTCAKLPAAMSLRCVVRDECCGR